MKILWLGDFFYDYPYISEDIKEIGKWIKNNNYKTILNLEGAIDSNCYKKINKRGPNLTCDIEAINALKTLNVVGVSLANNHMMDFGEEGLKHTLELLDKNGIAHTGAGINLKQALSPIVLEENGQKIAIYSFGWNIEETVYAGESLAGCAPRDEKIITQTIAKSSKTYNRTIACMHWGFEYNRYPMPYDIKLAHSMIDSGCDLIIGNHPHCVQPFELYKNKRIYYALGNFYFGSRRDNYKKVFREKTSNQSDFGVCVGYDSKNNSFTENLIEYSHNKKESSIIENKAEILKELSDDTQKSKNYYKKVKKNKQNINPILTNNYLRDKIKIVVLFLNYKLRKIAKKALRKEKRHE